MSTMQRACSRDQVTRQGEDFTAAALAFIHELCSLPDQAPFKLKSQLGGLAKSFRAGSAGAAFLIGNTIVMQHEVSADGQALPGLSWPADKWSDVAAKSRRSPAVVISTTDERSLLFASCSPQEGAVWLFWLEDEKQRSWRKGEQAALGLAALALARLIADHPDDERSSAWLERVRQQQTLESAAVVVGKLAHDFNNVLTGILGFSELCLGHLAAGTLPHQFATEVLQAAQKGNQLTSQLSHFSRRTATRPHPSCLANAVQAELARLEKPWGEAIGVRVEVPVELPPVAVDEVALRLILGHLLDNAREAISCTGTIAVLARQVELTRSDCLELFGKVTPGICLALSIADTGAGFSAEARQRALVDPFFSTKPRHRGFGLAAVYGVLYAHGGGIRLEHGDPSGTVVHVYLPIARQKTPTQGLRRGALPAAQGDTLLVVDDDPLTLRLMCTALERAGYKVQSAADGKQALECYCNAKEPFRLVLSDVVMPRMTGFDLAQHLLERDPNVNVLFTSGHIPAGFVPEGFAGRNFELLPKPFRPEGLVHAVRSALERESFRRAPSAAKR